MAVRFNPETGQWEDDSPKPASSVATMTREEAFMDPFERSVRDAEAQNKSANAQFLEAAKTGSNKPGWINPLENPGGFVDELGNIVGNAVVGLGTDFLDLGAGLADFAVAAGKSALKQDANWDQVFDDSDNPWTQWRRREFEAQSQAGKAASDLVRIGTLIATLPKSALKGAAFAPRVLSKVKPLGVVADAAGKATKLLDKADDALKAGNAAYEASTKALKATGFAKGTAGARAAGIAASDDWLRLTFKEVANVPEAADWMKGVQRTVKAYGRDIKGLNIKTVAQAIGWDALAAFSVAGEGDLDLDQTISDTLREMGMPSVAAFQTRFDDTALTRKFKQMTEGLVMAPFINGALDLLRLSRFSRNIAQATGAEREALLKAFNAQAEEIGGALVKLQPDQFGRPSQARLNSLYAGLETQRIGNRYQNDLLVADIQNRAVAEQMGLNNQQGMLPPGRSPEPKPPGAEPAGLLQPTGQMVQAPPPGALTDTGIDPVQVQVVRPPEPAVTPQTIRNAFQADAYDAFKRAQELTFQEGPDGVMRSMAELNATVKQLMPRTRVDAMEYITKFPPQANELGVIPAADSVWMNFITDRGLKEGWASIDPDTMQVRFNRKSALELDRGDLAAKQAQAMDELNELNRYQEWLWNKELVNGNPQMRPEVQDNLAAKEARDAYDQWEAARAADPAAADAERRAVTAGVEADQLDNSEALRISDQEAALVAGALDDQTVVREYLGTTLDSVQAPEVVKAEVGRGWDVYSLDGEKIATTRTQREAKKLAEAELQRSRQALIGRARQIEADGMDQALNSTVGQPVLDSEIVGSVKLTDSQIDAIQKFSPAIQNQMRADWEKRTGGQAWINLNDLKGGSKKTFELTQGEMYDLADGIKALLQTGEISGPRARVLRNVADKLSTSMKLLEPQARAQRFADNITAEAQRFIDHGDFC